MMLTVYLVDGTTRIILPGSQWAKDVLSWWAEHGISAVPTGEDPDTLKRSDEERYRSMDYLDMTGL
jgi:hypothetical protein